MTVQYKQDSSYFVISQPRLVDTRAACDSLKGIAISVILINHYLNHYWTGSIGGFGDLMVSVFFLLSGYGIFISMRKRLTDAFSIRDVMAFYRDRLLRIFPLYWLALFVQSLIGGNSYSLLSFLGVQGEGQYWFIPAIIQCYLFGFLMAYFLSNNSYATFIIVTVIFGFIHLAGTHVDGAHAFLNMPVAVDFSPYMELSFLHVYIFFLGMCCRCFDVIGCPTLFELRVPRRCHMFIFLLLLASVILSVFLDNLYSFPLSVCIALVIILSIYSVRNRIAIRCLSFLGAISFSMYLFHMSYYFFLERIGFLREDSLLSVAVTLVVLPLFILLCQKLEALGNRVSKKLKVAMG